MPAPRTRPRAGPATATWILAPISPTSARRPRHVCPRRNRQQSAAEEQLRDARVGQDRRRRYPRCASGPARAPARSRRSPAPAWRSARSAGCVTPLSRRSMQDARTPPAPSAATVRSTARRSGSAWGRAAAPRATSSSFCWPPDRVEACASAFSRSIGKRLIIAVDARVELAPDPASATPPSSRLCRTESSGKRLRPCGHVADAAIEHLRAACSRSCPGRRTRCGPSARRSRPKIALNRVDLPAPFGPITVVIAPRRILADAPLRMVILP